MGKFSFGGDDWEGSSNPDPKRQRTTAAAPFEHEPPSQQQTSNNDGQDAGDELMASLIAHRRSTEFVVHWPEADSAGVEVEEEEEEEEEGSEAEEEEEEEEEDDEEEDDEDDNNDQSQRGVTEVIGQSLRPDGPISVTLSDPEVLDCPICLEPLSLPVFQCENGHVACNCCCSKLRNKCPSCCFPIGYNRCRALEKVLESIQIECQNAKHGCKETVSYCKTRDHDLVCLHAPCSCPYSDCYFVGSSKKLYEHYSTQHAKSALRFSFNKVFNVTLNGGFKHVVLQERNESVIFIINYACENLGTVVNVNCIGPSTTARGFSCEVVARNGETSVMLQTIIESVPDWSKKSPTKAFLVVPLEFSYPGMMYSKLLKLEVCIKKPSGSPAGI